MPRESGASSTPQRSDCAFIKIRWLLDHPLSRVVTLIEALISEQCLSGSGGVRVEGGEVEFAGDEEEDGFHSEEADVPRAFRLAAWDNL